MINNSHHNSNQATRKFVAAMALGLAGLTLFGAACSGSDSSSSNTGFGNVEEVVVSETVNDDGSSETITVSAGRPASLSLTPLVSEVSLVSPAEYDPGESCEGFGSPEPVAEVGRGLGEQNGAQFAWFVTDYANEERAWSALTGTSFCYDNYAVDLAAELGRTPTESTLDEMQWAEMIDGEPVQFSIDVPSFDEAGPAIVSARTGGRLAMLIDLDNALDEHDAASLSVDLLLGS